MRIALLLTTVLVLTGCKKSAGPAGPPQAPVTQASGLITQVDLSAFSVLATLVTAAPNREIKSPYDKFMPDFRPEATVTGGTPPAGFDAAAT